MTTELEKRSSNLSPEALESYVALFQSARKKGVIPLFNKRFNVKLKVSPFNLDWKQKPSYKWNAVVLPPDDRLSMPNRLNILIYRDKPTLVSDIKFRALVLVRYWQDKYEYLNIIGEAVDKSDNGGENDEDGREDDERDDALLLSEFSIREDDELEIEQMLIEAMQSPRTEAMKF